MSDGKQDVLDAFFSDPGRQPLKVVDLRQLGGVPRTMNHEQRNVLNQLPPTRFALWLTLALLFGLPLLLTLPMLADLGAIALANVFLLPGVFTVLAVRSFVERKTAREQYYRVFENGGLTMARVRTLFVTEYRAKLRSTFRHELTFALPNGKVASMTTWYTGVDFLAVGMELEAVWLPELPDVIIPVQILPDALQF